MKNSVKSISLLIVILLTQPTIASEGTHFNVNSIFTLSLPAEVLKGAVISPLDDILIDLGDNGSIHVETFLATQPLFNDMDMRAIPKYLSGEDVQLQNSQVKSDLEMIKDNIFSKLKLRVVSSIKQQNLEILILGKNEYSQIYIIDKNMQSQMAIVYLKAINMDSLLAMTLNGIKGRDTQ